MTRSTLSFVDWSEPRRLHVATLFSLGYLTLAGVVVVATIAGVTASGLPFAIIALSALALSALVTSAVLAVDGLARAFTPGGIQHD